eukprot:jgi/Psemu1/13957/gm1.13957_g
MVNNASPPYFVTHRQGKMARAFKHIAGHLSDAHQLLKISQKRQLVNSPITPFDVQLMRAILSPSAPGLKGKTVRHKKQSVKADMAPIPQHIWGHYMGITMGIDIVYINSLSYLMLSDLIGFYKKRNFHVTTILTDGQFKPLTIALEKQHVELNLVLTDKHVPEAEPYNQTIKAQRCHCIFSTLPFSRILKRMIVETVCNGTFHLNPSPD